MAKFGLGKGLDALLPLNDAPSPEAAPDSAGSPGPGASSPEEALLLQMIPLDKLTANPDQPRKHFDQEQLQELADSIREHGVIEPLIVEDAGGGAYTIVAGERRSRAARMAGLAEIPALVRSYSGAGRMEVSLIENVQRTDLNPVEEARAYRRLMDLTGLSQDETALRVGKNRSTVANALRLLKLPQPMLDALEGGAISPGHGRALLSVAQADQQECLFQDILAQGSSVREAERRATLLNSGEPKQAASGGQSPRGETARKLQPELAAIEQQLIDVLGTKVSISGDLARGSIHIDYYSMDDLDRLLELLKQ
jgi:ParB family chromosome partitioning protein